MTEPTPVAPPVSPSGPSGPRASFGRRLVAALVDGILLGIVTSLIRTTTSLVLGEAITIALGVAYFGYLEGSPAGQTIGKRMLGIRVVDFSGGGPIGFGRAVIRYFGRIVSALPIFLGYFWMLWDKEKQTWHDKFANDVVVPVSAYPVERWPG